ncbi:MAG: ATP-binding protein [Planctomycetota bacterium]|nr:ATP-binding protein [Planctomycetota bacterium]
MEPSAEASSDARTPEVGPRERAPEERDSERAPERIRMLARLAAGLAHEIKNPLSTMAINLALLEEEWGRARDGGEPSARDKRCQKRVQTLQREVKRLETIVDDFLRYARGGEINRSPHDLVGIVREVLEFVESEDTLAGIRHHVDLPLGLPMVMLDEGAFKQALLNLFVNARQAMPMGGELIVRARREGNWVELSVTDTGTGMAAEALERCFDVYWSTKKGGTGLGLPTTKRIVEEHGGRIAAISELNRGTSFSIVLPLLVEIHGRPSESGASGGESGSPAANTEGGSA